MKSLGDTKPERRRNLFTTAVAITWLTASVAGLWFAIQHESTAGAAAHAVSSWPAKSKLSPAANKPTVVLFAHPECPCTRATLNQLARLQALAPERPKIIVALAIPGGHADWRRSAIADQARSLPGAEIFEDSDLAEAHLFHASTSGQCFVYGRSGSLLYHGGITGARGHEGDNTGMDNALNALNNRLSVSSPVFGCALEETNAN